MRARDNNNNKQDVCGYFDQGVSRILRLVARPVRCRRGMRLAAWCVGCYQCCVPHGVIEPLRSSSAEIRAPVATRRLLEQADDLPLLPDFSDNIRSRS